MSDLPKIEVEQSEFSVEIETEGQGIRLGVCRSDAGEYFCHTSIVIHGDGNPDSLGIKPTYIELDPMYCDKWAICPLLSIPLDEVILKMKLFIHAAEQIKAGYKD